ncbi:MAG: tetratricopeptide repeat protein [Planctomycetes bacterium]|nr:tetratricopeptide repeat protein [Planctomycetota bacterium]
MHAEQAYLFRHALLRDASYELQLPAQRGSLHLLAAELIEQLVGEAPEAAGEIADHLLSARTFDDRPGLQQREALWCARAASEAARAYMLPEALRRWLRVAAVSEGDEAGRAWLQAGAAARALGDRQQFEAASQHALALARAGTDRGMECEALEHTANVAFDRGDYATAAAITGQALELARQNGETRHELGLMSNQALNYLELGRLEDSAAVYAELMPRLDDNDESSTHAYLNYAMLLDRQGQAQAAHEWFQRALKLNRARGLMDSEASALNHLGTMAWKAQRLDEADDCFAQALALARRIGDPHLHALTLSNIGLLRQDQGRGPESLTVLKNAEALCEEFALASLHAISVANLAFAYRQLNQPHQAEACMQRSAEICLRYGDRAGHAMAMGNVASIYSGRGELERARQIFEAILPVEQELSQWRFLGNHRCEYSMVLAQLADLDAAGKEWTAGYALVLKHGTAHEIPRRLQRMQRVCGALGIAPFPTPA